MSNRGSSVMSNYRTRAPDIQPGLMQSLLVVFSDYLDIQDTYSIANPNTISMAGFGKPAYHWLAGCSTPVICMTLSPIFNPTASFSGSIGWFYVYISDGNYTGTLHLKIGALIASR